MGITLGKMDLDGEPIDNSIRCRNKEQSNFINNLKRMLTYKQDDDYINDANILIDNYNKKQKELNDELSKLPNISDYSVTDKIIDKYLSIYEEERNTFKLKYKQTHI